MKLRNHSVRYNNANEKRRIPPKRRSHNYVYTANQSVYVSIEYCGPNYNFEKYGLGLKVRENNYALYAAYVHRHSPAYYAGIKRNDFIGGVGDSRDAERMTDVNAFHNLMMTTDYVRLVIRHREHRSVAHLNAKMNGDQLRMSPTLNLSPTTDMLYERSLGGGSESDNRPHDSFCEAILEAYDM